MKVKTEREVQLLLIANFQEPPETCRVLIISTISAIYNYEFAIEKPAGKSKRKLFGQRRVTLAFLH